MNEFRPVPTSNNGHVDFEETLLKDVSPREREFRKISRRVCLIRRDRGTESTGFLVGPDLMLTTAHALLGTSGIFADPEEVTILFDQFIWNKKTKTRAWGARCKLRHIPFTRQPDVLASSIKTDPKLRRRHTRPHNGDNRLDYALVRLDRPIGLMYLPFSHRIRGWNDCSKADIAPGQYLRVIQHPFGGLQKFTNGTFDPYDHDEPDFPEFFKYRARTLNGASGSPIYDRERHVVVGMHVGERSPKEQFGVSFQAIFADLQKEGVTLPAFAIDKPAMDSIFGTSGIERERKPGHADWRGDRLFR
jgi:hypothetical protein